MNDEELVNGVAKAIMAEYVSVSGWTITWDEIDDGAKAAWRMVADAAIMAYRSLTP